MIFSSFFFLHLLDISKATTSSWGLEDLEVFPFSLGGVGGGGGGGYRRHFTIPQCSMNSTLQFQTEDEDNFILNLSGQIIPNRLPLEFSHNTFLTICSKLEKACSSIQITPSNDSSCLPQTFISIEKRQDSSVNSDSSSSSSPSPTPSDCPALNYTPSYTPVSSVSSSRATLTEFATISYFTPTWITSPPSPTATLTNKGSVTATTTGTSTGQTSGAETLSLKSLGMEGMMVRVCVIGALIMLVLKM